MDKYTTDALDKLREVEKTIKALEDENTIELMLTTNTKIPEAGALAVARGYGGCVGFIPTDVIYKNILSMLKAEQYKLKQELKDSLDIGENTHWEEG